MRAIEDGLYQPSMKARLSELESEKAALTMCNGTGSEVPPNIWCIRTLRPCTAGRWGVGEFARRCEKRMRRGGSFVRVKDRSDAKEGGLMRPARRLARS
jgi:hypothetical protein